MASPAVAQPIDRELKKQFATWFQAADTGTVLQALLPCLRVDKGLAANLALDHGHLITSASMMRNHAWQVDVLRARGVGIQ
jgi:hypothetical protein